MTEWRHLVPDRPFIMGQMASFAPFFSRLDAPRSNTPFTFFVPSPSFLCENLSMVIPLHGGEWMKYLQIISAAALSHYWQKPNKQGYRGAACKYLVVSRKRSQTKSQKNPVQTSLWQISWNLREGEILALPIYLFRVNRFNGLVCLSKLTETT